MVASLYYRKVDQFLINFLLGEDSGLTAPVVEMSRVEATVRRCRSRNAAPGPPGGRPPFNDRGRRAEWMSMPETSPEKTLRPARRRGSRRHGRVRRIAGVLAAIGLAAAVAGVLIYQGQAARETRRPGEDLPEITEKLARDLPADAPVPRFVDVTAAAGLGGFVTFNGPRSSQLPEDMGAGLAWGDFDNDGDDDLFLVSAGGGLASADPRSGRRRCSMRTSATAPSERVMAFPRRWTNVAFPETRILGMAAAWGDADGDGWLDLAVTGYGSLLLFRNREGRLEPRRRRFADVRPEGYWAGVILGRLRQRPRPRSLRLRLRALRAVRPAGGERRATEQYGAAVPYTLNPASYEPERNLLFHATTARCGRYDCTSREVAALYGVSNPEGRSLSALWHDFDDDGRLDLYVANDISDNALYLNRQDTFEDVGLQAFVADYRGAMGLAAGDWNRDGDDDLFITHWIAQENALYDSRPPEPAAGDRPPAPRRRLTFSDMAVPLGLGQIALQSIGWGTEFADFDADGWLDLVIANGSDLRGRCRAARAQAQPPLPAVESPRRALPRPGAGRRGPGRAPRRPRPGTSPTTTSDGDLDVAIWSISGKACSCCATTCRRAAWLASPSCAADGSPAARRVSSGSGRLAPPSSPASATSSCGARSPAPPTYPRAAAPSTSASATASSASTSSRCAGWPVSPRSSPGLEANAVWELTEGDPEPSGSVGRRVPDRCIGRWGGRKFGCTARRADKSALSSSGRPSAPPWTHSSATATCRAPPSSCAQALELNPAHGDSRYYLANCLAVQGQDRRGPGRARPPALATNPTSHRAHKQWGVLRALDRRLPRRPRRRPPGPSSARWRSTRKRPAASWSWARSPCIQGDH